MSRPLRIEYPGAFYHVMNRGCGGQEVFHTSKDYERLLNLLSETSQMWGIRIHAYSLLPNHYHILLETPQGNLSRAMRHIDGIYTQRYNRAHQTDGPLFRGRYKAILVDANNYLLQVVRYIHLNPVKAKLEKDPALHPWTSHRYYLGRKKEIDGLITEDVFGRFHLKRKEALRLYRRYIREGVDEEANRWYKQGRIPAIWGKEGFREKVQELIDQRGEDYEIPQRREIKGRPTLLEIEREICREYGIHSRELLTKRRGYWNEPRNIAIFLGRKLGGYRLKELGERWGGLKYSTTSGMVYAMGKRIEEKNIVEKKVNKIEDAILKSIT